MMRVGPQVQGGSDGTSSWINPQTCSIQEAGFHFMDMKLDQLLVGFWDTPHIYYNVAKTYLLKYDV